jgi:hypothetical protein
MSGFNAVAGALLGLVGHLPHTHNVPHRAPYATHHHMKHTREGAYCGIVNKVIPIPGLDRVLQCHPKRNLHAPRRYKHPEHNAH